MSHIWKGHRFFFLSNKKVNKGLFVMRMGPEEVWGEEAREDKVVLNMDVKQLNRSVGHIRAW